MIPKTSLPFMSETQVLPAIHQAHAVDHLVYGNDKNLLHPLSALPLRLLLIQFLIKKLLWTCRGEEAWVSMATGSMCTLSEQLLLHSSFLGSRRHVFYRDNWDNGADSTTFGSACKGPRWRGAFAVLSIWGKM